MAGINKVILIGHMGKDPEVRALESGVKVATFSLATTESYKDKDGNWQDQTEWHNIVAWRNQAESAEKYFKKGAQIYIEGKLRTRSWTDQNNQTRYITEIVAERLMMLGKREGSQPANNPPLPSVDDYPQFTQQSQSQPKTQEILPETKSTSANSFEDDLPF